MYLFSVELCIEEVKQQIHVHLGLAKQIEDGLNARSVKKKSLCILLDTKCSILFERISRVHYLSFILEFQQVLKVNLHSLHVHPHKLGRHLAERLEIIFLKLRRFSSENTVHLKNALLFLWEENELDILQLVWR